MGAFATISLAWLTSLFSYTGALKALTSSGDGYLRAHGILPTWSVRPVALILPFAELGIVALLVVAPSRALGGVVASLFGACFAAYIAIAISRKSPAPCGCGGPIAASSRLYRLAFGRACASVVAGGAVVAGGSAVAPGVPWFCAAVPVLPAVLLRRRMQRHQHRHAEAIHGPAVIPEPRADLVALLRETGLERSI